MAKWPQPYDAVIYNGAHAHERGTRIGIVKIKSRRITVEGHFVRWKRDQWEGIFNGSVINRREMAIKRAKP